MTLRVLVVEDDPYLSAQLRSGLAEHGMTVSHVGSAAKAWPRIASDTPDVIVLDVLLPGVDGFSFCEDLRTRGVVTPIVMLTARDAVDDRVRGLGVGADDYLVKPFAFRELVARLQAVVRRHQAPVVRHHDLVVDLRARTARRGRTTIALTAKEFALLEIFVQHPNEVLDRATICARVWDDNHDPFTNVLEVLVKRLRAKLDTPYKRKFIETIRGAGYAFRT